MGTLKTPRMTICNSGVTTSAASRRRQMHRTAFLMVDSRLSIIPPLAAPIGRFGFRLLHRLDFLDHRRPFRKILADLGQHRLAECWNIEAVLGLDKGHALAFE